jgi:hypothetical protein
MIVDATAGVQPSYESMTLEDSLISIWRQVFAEGAKTVTLAGATYPIRRSSRSKLREVDFTFEGTDFRGVEQNPSTSSRWAKLAREGKNVMQFLSDGRYIANVADGKVMLYQAWREPKG